MKKAKIMLSWMLHPPVWVLCTIPTVVFAALIFVFATGKTESALAYPVYLMSAYSLVILLAVAPRLTSGSNLLYWTAQLCRGRFPHRSLGDT